MNSSKAKTPQFRALIKRIQAKIIMQGVVSDREDAILRRYTDYYDLPRKVVKTPPGEYNK